ncbi:MAG: hypothetical protein AAB550_03715 [Patescibacteria group bacterium]
MADYKIGTVVSVYPSTSCMAVDLVGDVHLGDRLRINNHKFIVTILKDDYHEVESAKRGSTIITNMDFGITEGDELITSS